MAVRKNAKRLLITEYIEGKLGLSLYDIDEPLDHFIENLQSAKKQAKEMGYTEIHIKVEQDFDSSILYVTGKREETDKELTKRLNQQKKEREAKKKAKADKEERERTEYERLKRKFG